MKKLAFVFATVVAVSFASCGNKAATAETETDSIDTVCVESVDTVCVEDSACCCGDSTCCSDSLACQNDSCCKK